MKDLTQLVILAGGFTHENVLKVINLYAIDIESSVEIGLQNNNEKSDMNNL